MTKELHNVINDDFNKCDYVVEKLAIKRVPLIFFKRSQQIYPKNKGNTSQNSHVKIKSEDVNPYSHDIILPLLYHIKSKIEVEPNLMPIINSCLIKSQDALCEDSIPRFSNERRRIKTAEQLLQNLNSTETFENEKSDMKYLPKVTAAERNSISDYKKQEINQDNNIHKSILSLIKTVPNGTVEHKTTVTNKFKFIRIFSDHRKLNSPSCFPFESKSSSKNCIIKSRTNEDNYSMQLQDVLPNFYDVPDSKIFQKNNETKLSTICSNRHGYADIPLKNKTYNIKEERACPTLRWKVVIKHHQTNAERNIIVPIDNIKIIDQ